MKNPITQIKDFLKALFAKPSRLSQQGRLETCDHKWVHDGDLYVKCEKCGEVALYIGGQR